jgi:Spy/CpxP family protein refolding chaperone
MIAATVLLAAAGNLAFGETSPYVGQQDRSIKALSSEQLEQLKNGTGMGLAKPAELNHYPGPRHVLDLGGDLGLTRDQRASIEAAFRRMHESAVEIGAVLIEKEQALDTGFAEGNIDADHLAALTTEIGALEGRLRNVHLAAHLETRQILMPHQVMLYDQLRGYDEKGGASEHHRMHH